MLYNKPFRKSSFRALLLILVALTGIIPLMLHPAVSLSQVSGSVFGWGANNFGQITIPSDNSNIKAIAAGSIHSLALKNDGTVIGWGGGPPDISEGQATPPPGLSNVTAIAAGTDHSLALKSDGTVVAWGSNRNGQLNVPQDLTNVAAIGGGQAHSLVLKDDGTVVGWGAFAPAVTPPDGLTDVVAIAAGGVHSLALKSDGTVVAWGDNSGGQLNIPSGLTDVVAIAAGFGHNLALKNDGTVVGWGFDLFGQAPPTPPAGLSGVIAITAGAFHSMALKSDGTVTVWGFNSAGFLAPPAGLSNVVAIAAGFDHNLALMRAFDINDLIALVNGLNIHHGIKNSLLAKLNAARAAMEAGDTGTACNNLAAFINECQAQSGKKLSEDQANVLIASANEIRTSLGCP